MVKPDTLGFSKGTEPKVWIYTLKGNVFVSQHVGQVVYEQLSHTGEAENLLVVQPMRLDVSAVPVWHRGPGIPGEMLVFSLHCGPGKLALRSAEDCSRLRKDGLAS